MSNIMNVDISIDEHSKEVEMDTETIYGSGTNDYEKLKNLPTLNGRTIIGDVSEQDPTVPDWAKEETKPTYTAEEIGAINANNEISFADIKSIWDSIFNK